MSIRFRNPTVGGWALAAGALLAVPVLQQSLAADEPGERTRLAIAVDFPGGSADVDNIDQKRRSIRVRPGGQRKHGWVCWWSFRVDGVEPGETLTLDVGDGVWATPTRAAFSLDGKNWSQTGPGKREKGRIVYTQKVDGKSVWFAWGPPFVPDDAEQLVQRTAKKSKWATAFALCKTRGGRNTPALRISQPGVPDDQRLGIWIQARQHAWESGSSWVCKGLVDWIVSDDARAVELRKKATVVVVPVMDVDGAAEGQGGKNRIPQDHNRDWSDEPHWRGVAAAQLEIRKMHAAGNFDMFVDLHNPGAGERNPFFFVAPDELLTKIGKRNLQAFLDATKTEMTGPLAFKGKTRASGANYDRNWKKISKNWVAVNTGEHVVSLTLETAWNTPNSTQAGYQQVGRELGLAVERYFRKPRRK